MTKRKQERRELLKRDEFLSTMEQAARYIQAHPRRVSMYVAIIVLGLSALAAGLSMHRARVDHAAADLYKARQSYVRGLEDPFLDSQFKTDKEKNEAALNNLDSLVNNSSGASRLQGLIYKASCELDLGQYDQAVKTYEELAKDKAEYGIIGLIALGDLSLGNEDFTKAIDYFSQAQGKTNADLFEDVLTMRLAKAHQKKGDLENAEIELEGLVQKYEAIDDSEKPPIHQEAKKLLEEIKADRSS